MFEQPHALAGRASADRRRPLFHEGERLFVSDRRVAHAPFDVGRHLVHVRTDGERGSAGQALRVWRRLRITAPTAGRIRSMSSLSISAAWDETRSILVREGKLLAAVALALIVLPQTVFAVIGAPVGPQSSGLSLIAYFVVILLGCAAQIALNRLAIGPSVTVGSAIATGFQRLASVAAVGVLAAIAVMVVATVLLLILSSAGLMAVPRPGQAPPASLVLMLVAIV